MAEPINVLIALQTPDGLAFGYVLDATPRHMTFTVNSNLPIGTTFAWRMELKGYAETIMGQLSVTQGYPARSVTDWPRYEARVDQIPDDDAVLLKVWMEDQDKGGSSRRLEQDPDRFIKDMFAEGMSGASTAQTNLVIERMNERRARRERLFKKKKRGVGGDFGLSTEAAENSASVSSASLRSQITKALGGFARRKLGEPEPPPPAVRTEVQASTPPQPEPEPPPLVPDPVLPDPSSVTDEIIAAALEAAGLQSSGAVKPPLASPVEDLAPRPPDDERDEVITQPEPAVLEEASQDDDPVVAESDEPLDPQEEVHDHVVDEAPEPAEVAEPPANGETRISFDSAQTPPLLEVRYHTGGNFQDDFRRHLKNGGLFLKGQQMGARGDKLAVRLVLPSGHVMACEAKVVASLAAGTGLMLSLSRDQRDRLANEAG